jgi:hypothetical protein
VPPVRRPESSTAVKAKTSAPLPLPATSCAALTRCAVSLPSPHREGTRSRRCGRRLTRAQGGRFTSARKGDVGTVSAAPADWATIPPLSYLFFVRFQWGLICASTYGERLRPPNTWWVEKRDPVGVPLPTSDQKCGFNPISGVPTRPPDFFQESSSKASGGFCGIVASRERPDRASPSIIAHMFFPKIKRWSEIFCPKRWASSRKNRRHAVIEHACQEKLPIAIRRLCKLGPRQSRLVL